MSLIELSKTESTLLLAIDDVSLQFRKNVGLYLSKPTIRPEPVLGPSTLENSAPDDRATHFYGTVLHDQGKFRMWYYACHWGKNPDWPPRKMQQVVKTPGYTDLTEFHLYQGPLCYAESDDGIRWNKPALNQIRFKGNTVNNALDLPHTIVSGATVIRDDEDPSPERRYKMVYQFFPDQSDPVIDEYGTMPSVALAVSPDGLRWKVVGIPFRNQFIEHCSFIKHQGRYTIHYQVMDSWAGTFSEGGAPCGRTGLARTTYDFEHWPDQWCEAFALPEPRDPKLRGMSGAYDQLHMGVGARSFGNVCVGLYGIWHNAHFKQAFHDISCDLGLLISNDGLHFREPEKGNVFIHRDESPATPLPNQKFNTVLTQGNGILNVGDKTHIYHGRWRNTGNGADNLRHYRGEVALATLPRDRWGALALNPNAKEGAVCTAPVRLTATGLLKMSLNAEGASALRVEILDEKFNPIREFSASQSGTVQEREGLDCGVKWKSDLAPLAGQTTRFRICMETKDELKPRLFAANLSLE